MHKNTSKKNLEIDREKLDAALEKVLHSVTNFIGITANYDYSIETYEQNGETREFLQLKLQSEHDPLLIGYHGQTLDRLQFLIQLGLATQLESKIRVVLHISDYREKRQQTLEDLARRAQQQVISSGVEMELNPMKADERRVIHAILAEEGKVLTESAGEGSDRHIIVKPKL